MGCVYLARCKVNGKGYIGFTFDLEKRKGWHRKDAEENGSGLLFHNAIRKHGWDSFEWSILFEDDDNDREWLGWWEQKFIKKLNTKMPNGYNMTDGGDGVRGWEHSSEWREKRRKTQLGVKPSIETRRKMSAWQIGKVLSEETKKKISEAKRGKHLSAEHKEKLSRILIGRCFSEQHRKNLSKAMRRVHRC